MSHYALFLLHWVILGASGAVYWHFFRGIREGSRFSDRYLHGLAVAGFLAFYGGSFLSQYELLLSVEPRLEYVGWDTTLYSVSLAAMGAAVVVGDRVLRGWEDAQIRRWVWFDLWLIVLVVAALFASLRARTIAPHLGLCLLGMIQIIAIKRRARSERR